MGHINALWKKNRKSYFVWLALFFLFKIFKYNYLSWKCIDLFKCVIDDSMIVRSIVMGLKNYCWDKSGFESCKLNQFLQTRFCQSFSHRRIIENSFLPLPGSWTWTHRCFRTVHTSRPRKCYPSIPSEHMLYFKEWLMCNDI